MSNVASFGQFSQITNSKSIMPYHVNWQKGGKYEWFLKKLWENYLQFILAVPENNKYQKLTPTTGY